MARGRQALVATVLAILVLGGLAAAPPASATTRANAPTVTGIFATFDTPKSTADGFTVNVTNYSTDYAWSVRTDAGQVHSGTANGSTWPITVTGLRAGEDATVEVSAVMPGLETSDASVSGFALPAAGGQTLKGTATERLQFTGPSPRVDSAGMLVLQRLVARIPSGATVKKVVIAVNAPVHASAAQLRLARSRANSIARYLAGRGITPVPSITTPRTLHPGTATASIAYLH